MCNLYSLTKGQAAILEMTRAMVDRTGNLPPLPGIFPDYEAPIVRNGSEGRELSLARWGMPSPAFALKGRNSDSGVTNVRNTQSPHWRRWLGPESRCVVPFTSFSEPETLDDGKKQVAWFALGEDRPLGFFAGICTRWTSVRKVKEGETTNELFAFLTTEPNAEVALIHPKAMPVILTEPEEIETWLTAPAADALKLQRPLPDGRLKIVSRGPSRTAEAALPQPKRYMIADGRPSTDVSGRWIWSSSMSLFCSSASDICSSLLISGNRSWFARFFAVV